jgi:glucoamylase
LRHDAVNEALSLKAAPKAAGGQGIGVRKNVSMLRTKSGVIGVSCMALALATALPAAAQEFFGDHNPTIVSTGPASNGPGMASPWSNAMKQGIGSSYEAYKDFKYSDTAATGKVSKVWFSLAQGIVTETMFGRIDQAQIRELKFAVTGKGWTAFEGDDTTSHIAYIHTDADGRPLSPAYRVTTTDKQGRFVIIKDVLTDPDRQSLVLRVTVKALKGPVTPYLILDPSVANTSGDDEGRANVDALTAWQGKAAISLRSNLPFKKASVGYTGVSDNIAELTKSQALGTLNSSLKGGKGNILMVAQLAPVTKAATQDFALGFGGSAEAASSEASATLKAGYAKVLAKFNADWDGYLASLTELKSLVPLTGDNGKLLYSSAIALKVQEDRTYAGALIASLSNPWGDALKTDVSHTGYKAVWPRDFYQVAMALAALGDKQTPVAAYRYLPTVQVTEKMKGNSGATGWFLQKTHVDGTLEWVGVQLDQTAMPILLGARLESMGLIQKDELLSSYETMLKPAADFLSHGGKVGLDWNTATITPPYAQQERWEEQEGHSPSTTAAIIAGLVAAANIATQAGDTDSAKLYIAKADEYSQKLDQRLLTTTGKVRGEDKPATYYLRISRSEDANNPGVLDERNGLKGLRGDLMVDGGFLELVRYGVRPADDKKITGSLAVLDDQTLPENLRVRYDFKFGDLTVPGFRRYGNDGYGDKTSGGDYGDMTPDQRGRVWPIFTGERGHYELAVDALKPGGATEADIQSIRATYVRGMEAFANEGLMLPEQVFDGVGSPGPHGYVVGEGTESATPLAWSHAEYVKLLRSLRDKAVWDRNPTTARHFQVKE